MLCNDGLQAFDLAAVAFAAGVLIRCLSCLTACNVFFREIIVIDYDSKGNELSYLLVLFRLFYFTAGSPLIWRRLWLLLRFQQWLLRFCILFSPQHLHNLCKFQKNVKGLNLLNRRK